MISVVRPAPLPSLPLLKWPKNSFDIGLSPRDIQTLEIFIRTVQAHRQTSAPSAAIKLKCSKYFEVIERKKKFRNSEGEELPNPRRLVISTDAVFVVLNTKNGVQTIQGGKTQSKMKLVHNACTGELFIKKRIFSIEQETLVRFIMAKDQTTSGFAEIGHIENRKGKINYFEKKYSKTLAEHYRTQTPKKSLKSFDRLSLIQMYNALKSLHEIKYHPPTLVFAEGNSIDFNHVSYCYHGDISPHNCVVGETPQGLLEIRLIDYGFSRDLFHVMALSGWDAPETVELTDGDQLQYNIKYGRQKDTWQFALLLGTILNGGVVFEKHINVPLPYFSFIIDKLKVCNERIDKSGLSEITQEEVDLEISGFIKKESSPKIKKMWETIGKWLIVDPAKRPSLTEVAIS